MSAFVARLIQFPARNPAPAAVSAFLNAEQARGQQLRLREQVRTVQQEHARLMQGLSAEQQLTVQQRARSMQQYQERINTRLQAMDQELSSTQPHRQHVAEHARAMEQEMNRWQTQNRAMAADLGLQF